MALRTSGQVMSAIAMVFGSGAVRGRVTTTTAIEMPASALKAILAADHGRLPSTDRCSVRACKALRKRPGKRSESDNPGLLFAKPQDANGSCSAPYYRAVLSTLLMPYENVNGARMR